MEEAELLIDGQDLSEVDTRLGDDLHHVVELVHLTSAISARASIALISNVISGLCPVSGRSCNMTGEQASHPTSKQQSTDRPWPRKTPNTSCEMPSCDPEGVCC